MKNKLLISTFILIWIAGVVAGTVIAKLYTDGGTDAVAQVGSELEAEPTFFDPNDRFCLTCDTALFSREKHFYPCPYDPNSAVKK